MAVFFNVALYGNTGSTPTFQALFHYYADAICSKATLSVLASGHYSPGSDSERVQGATEFDFFVQSVIITVHDESTARNLNGLKVRKVALRNVDVGFFRPWKSLCSYCKIISGQSVRTGRKLAGRKAPRCHPNWGLYRSRHSSAHRGQR